VGYMLSYKCELYVASDVLKDGKDTLTGESMIASVDL